MADTGAPPVIPTEFQQYNSYAEDPKWQRKFSIIWPCVLALFVLFSLPRVVRAVRSGRALRGMFFGVLEGREEYALVGREGKKASTHPGMRGSRHVQGMLSAVGSVVYWTPPGIGLNAGQLFLLAAYFATVIVCMTLDAPLMSNSNRPGFIALAQFPIIFLFATKNSILSLLLGPGSGYEKLNFIHRWSGRVMFLGAVLHGSMWIRNHLEYNLPIIGEQKEGSGVAALGALGAIVLTSLKPVRKWFYEVFFVLHIMTFVAFFITVCYHTIYASPWIFPPLAFYGLDLLMRMFRVRIKDALLVPVDSQMTLIHIPYCTSGWTAGQHVRLRVFFSGRIFESHPLTILSAPPSTTCLGSSSSYSGGITLGARVMGDWSGALNTYALKSADELLGDSEKDAEKPAVPVQVMLDGPYGGCSVDLGEYESVLLFAGGSGATFTLGLLDDIVGRCVRNGRSGGERTRRIEFAWCVRSFASIEWFSSALMDIATTAALSSSPSSTSQHLPLDLHISIYVTCLCNPEAVPPIPNCDVTIVRPSIYSVLSDLVALPSSIPLSTRPAKETEIETETEKEKAPKSAKAKGKNIRNSTSTSAEVEIDLDTEAGDTTMRLAASGRLPWARVGGGVAVCASGPAGLTREAANAVARLQMTGRGVRMGGVALHTEVFDM